MSMATTELCNPLPIPFPQGLVLRHFEKRPFATRRFVMPALPGTVVQLDLLLNSRTWDLDEVTNLVRSDLGLTIEVLRRCRFQAEEPDAPWRISDCVVQLGSSLRDIAVPLVFSPQAPSTAVQRTETCWRMSRIIASAAEAVSRSMSDLDVDPEEAYLAGLTHALGELPEVLDSVGYYDRELLPESAAELARLWNLPDCCTAMETGRLSAGASGSQAMVRVLGFAKDLVISGAVGSGSTIWRQTRETTITTLFRRWFPELETVPASSLSRCFGPILSQGFKAHTPQSAIF